MALSQASTLLAEGLQKRYGSRTVVRDVSIEVKSGEVVGLLGPNGAGKSTLLKAVFGLIKPDSGEIKIDYTTEIFSTNTILLQCDDNNDGISIFNLTKVANIVKNNSLQITNQGYYETLKDARNKTIDMSEALALPGCWVSWMVKV